MPLESYHNTPPDASFSGTGSSAWVEAHNLRMEGGGFLVGRETAGTGAPENIAIGANLTLSGGTLSASGGAGGTNTFALAGDVLGTGLVPGTLTSALSTTGIAAGTYGGTAGIPRFDIDAKGRMLLAASHPLQGSAPIAITTGAGTFVVSHNTSGVAAGTFGTGNDLVQLTVNALGHVTSIATSGTIGTMGRFSSYTMAGAALGTSTTGTMTVALSTTGVTAGTYGNATNVGQFTVDAGGRITLATNVSIAGAGTLAVTQGTTTVSTVNRIHFTTNATVTSTAAGIADVAITAGTGGSSTWDTIGAAAGDGTTSNTTHRIVYQVAATADSRISWRFTESAASSGGTSTSGVPNQVLLQLDTVAASTMSPIKVLSRGSFVFAVSPTTAQILAASGSSSEPTYSFASSTGSGMCFLSSAVQIRYAGSFVLAVKSTGQIAGLDGSASVPTFISNNDTDTGIFFATDVVAAACAGREIVRWKSSSAGGGWQIMDEADSNPTTTELDASDSFAVYMKADKLVFAYNLAGVMNYLTIPLDGSTTTWTNGTTAP